MCSRKCRICMGSIEQRYQETTMFALLGRAPAAWPDGLSVRPSSETRVSPRRGSGTILCGYQCINEQVLVLRPSEWDYPAHGVQRATNASPGLLLASETGVLMTQ